MKKLLKFQANRSRLSSIFSNSLFIVTSLALIALFTFFGLPDTTKPAQDPQGNCSIYGKITDAETGEELFGVNILIEGTNIGTSSNFEGKYKIDGLNAGSYSLVFKYIGYEKQSTKVSVREPESKRVDMAMPSSNHQLDEVVIVKSPKSEKNRKENNVRIEMPAQLEEAQFSDMALPSRNKSLQYSAQSPGSNIHFTAPEHNTEEYDRIYDNSFKNPSIDPLSTFSIDVDAAAYSNMRRFINANQAPPKDAIRIEEMVNYFVYDYQQPKGEQPFSIYTEVAECPWNQKTKLIHIGLQGKDIDYEEAAPSNLVFLLDVSGSMNADNKLPLVKKSLIKLVDQLGDNDRVALVVYAGAAGLVLPSTPASQKSTINSALNNLQAGGSTAGGAGLRLAYDVAVNNLIEGGNNRVILCTDGDFNVGVSSDAEMVRLIEEKRNSGVFITVCGFGMGNYKDSKMEKIADKGNGNYYYIDQDKEAQKVFVNEMRSTLFTIAKDVKIQIEFNPAIVSSYRLIGYENRILNKEDFNDDTKDAGELGAGHTVTALYEVLLTSDATESGDSDPQLSPENIPLKYQQSKLNKAGNDLKEMATIKLRYKNPDSDVSKLIEHVLINTSDQFENTSDNFRFSAAVSEFGMILRDSKFKGNGSISQVIELAEGAKGKDGFGYRAEFISLVKKYSNQMASK